MTASARPLVHALLGGCVIALAITAVMTYLDWRLNPNALFHDQGGTDWRIVGETAASWFMPVFPLAFVLALPVSVWRARRAGGPIRDV